MIPVKKAPFSPSMNIFRKSFCGFLAFLLLGLALSACGANIARPDSSLVDNSPNAEQNVKPTETQLPTLTPTPTETLTPTATETPSPTPTPTATPEPYPIDMEKLSNPPQSYEDFVNNLDKFVQAPSPDGSDEKFAEFVTWYNEKLFIETLGGDLEKIPVNYDVRMISIGADMLIVDSYGTKQERRSLPYFFYFKDRNGVAYPCYVVTVATPDYQQTLTVVGKETTRQARLKYGYPDMIAEIYQSTNSVYYLPFFFDKSEYYSDIENDLIDKGFGSCWPSTVGEIPIGFGGLSFDNK